jgi:hypothetical protein
LRSIVGSSGNSGGRGSFGISGRITAASISNGGGRSGSLGNASLVCTKCGFGKITVNPISIRDRSIVIFGRWNGGIGKIGISGHSNLNLHE